MNEKVNRIIGMVVTAGELRAAEISGKPSKIRVSAYGSAPLPDGAVSDGLILKPEVFMQCLKDMLSAGGFKSKSFVVEIADQNLILRIASFPKVPDQAQQENVIKYQAQDFIPIPLSDLELGYAITGEGEGEDGTPAVNALLVAAKSDVITAFVDTMQDRRFGSYEVNDVTIGVTALADEISSRTTASSYMVMHLKGSSLNILIISGGNIVMARSAQLDASLSAALNRGGDDDMEITDKVTDLIKTEYLASINYQSGRQSGKNPGDVEKLYIYSHSADISGSVRNIEADLGVDTEIIDIGYKLHADGGFPAGKFLGCVCIAAAKL